MCLLGHVDVPSIRAPNPAVWACYGLRMEGTFPIIETRRFGRSFYFANEMCRFWHVSLFLYYPHIPPLIPHSLPLLFSFLSCTVTILGNFLLYNLLI